MSTSPGLSQVGEASQEDRDLMETEREEYPIKSKIISIKQKMVSGRSSMVKKLLPTKSLLLVEDVSEVSTNESLLLTEAPSFKEDYKRRENIGNSKEQRGGNLPDTSYDQSVSLSSRIVSRRSPNTTDLGSFISTSKDPKKNENTSLVKDVVSKMKLSQSGVGRKTGEGSRKSCKSWLSSSGGTGQTWAGKARKTRSRRSTCSTSLATGKIKRSTKLFSDDEDEDITKMVESPFQNPV